MKYLSFALTLTLFVCANKTESASSTTRLAVNNTNTGSVTTVTVTSASDSSKVATFSSLTGSTTTASQEVSFSGSANVVCSSGCTNGSVNLTSGQNNTITIFAGTAPTIATASSGGSGW